MKGRIVKLADGHYRIILSLPRDQKTGKYRQKWFTVHGSRPVANRRLSELEAQYYGGDNFDKSKITVQAFLLKWLDTCRHYLTPKSFDRYQGICNHHLIPDFGHLNLDKLRPEHLQHHYDNKIVDGLSPATVHYHHIVMHAALEYAVKMNYVTRNIADMVTPPKNDNRLTLNYWDIDEVNRFLAYMEGKEYYTLFYLALFTGMRRSELLGLQWGDIDFLGCEISVRRGLHQISNGEFAIQETKSPRSRRSIALTPSTLAVLKTHRNTIQTHYDGKRSLLNKELVFCIGGNPIRPNKITLSWKKACIEAGVKVIHLHDARHTHATLLLKQGVHAKIVQERLGHSNIGVTLDIYSHIIPGMQQAAAAGFDKLVFGK